MGTFNTVVSELICPSCELDVTLQAQFKYGDVWQHEYRIGDKLKWGANNIGQLGENVVVDGAGDVCPRCQYDMNDLEIWIIEGIIQKVVLSSGEFDFSSQEENYSVLPNSQNA